jgi:hypothetical protein
MAQHSDGPKRNNVLAFVRPDPDSGIVDDETGESIPIQSIGTPATSSFLGAGGSSPGYIRVTLFDPWHHRRPPGPRRRPPRG